MHAVDPLQRLRLSKTKEEMEPELAFHREMHMNYVLTPSNSYTAYLPFLLQECFDEIGRAHQLVTKVAQGFQHPIFVPGVEVLYWNGAPMARTIEANAQRQAGISTILVVMRPVSGSDICPGSGRIRSCPAGLLKKKARQLGIDFSPKQPLRVAQSGTQRDFCKRPEDQFLGYAATTQLPDRHYVGLRSGRL